MQKLSKEQILDDFYKNGGYKVAIRRQLKDILVFILLIMGVAICVFFKYFAGALILLLFAVFIGIIAFYGLEVYELGVFRINRINKQKDLITKGKYIIKQDTVKDKYFYDDGVGIRVDFCYLRCEGYFNHTGGDLRVNKKVYENMSIGEGVYLVYIDGEKTPINIYKMSEYYM